MLYNILILLLPITYLVIWWKGAQVREIAIQSAKKVCKQYQVQFLDDTVVRCGWKFIRSNNGHLVLRRSFRFEFSPDGNSRFQGHITTLSKRILSVDLEPYPDTHYY